MYIASYYICLLIKQEQTEQKFNRPNSVFAGLAATHAKKMARKVTRQRLRSGVMNGNVQFEYDLFVSYADGDRAWVEGYLLDALNQAGIRCHSESAFTLGAPRLLEFERAIKQSRWTLLILSPAYLAEGFTQFIDLLAQSHGLETATWPVIPLTLRPVPLPTRLSMLTGLDATDPSGWEATIRRLCDQLQHPVPGPAVKPSCPYPGMVPFSAKDARFFYGREDEIGQMLQHLRHQRYLWVIGPSGSGKSSLVFAGLLPGLNESSYFSSGYWLVRSMRPGSQPTKEFAVTLGGDISKPVESVTRLLASNSPSQRLLLVIDQFEELFTQTERTEEGRLEQARFIAALKGLRAVEKCALLIAMRADFYPDLMNSDLWPVDKSQRVEIGPLRGEALRRAIERPARDIGVFLEAGLVERILSDAADEPGVLPLLQETMVQLWEKMQRRLLPLSAYESLGGKGGTGLAVAVVTKADTTLADLSPAQKAIARRIFLRLVQFGEGRADTRRQQTIADLASVGEAPLFDQVLRHLADNRLLTLSGEEKGLGRKVDIAHEALITGWPQLHDWITQRRDAEKTRRRLDEKVQDWKEYTQQGKGEGGLLDAVELKEADQWLKSPDAVDLGPGDLPALVQASSKAIERVEQEKEAARQRELKQAEVALDAFYTLTYEVPKILDSFPETGEIRKRIVGENLKQLERLLESTNRGTRVLRELATNYRLLGQILYELDELKEAHQAYQKSVDLCKELVDREPKGAFYYRDLAVSHFNVGLFVERRDKPGACEHYRDSRDSARRAIDLDPEGQEEWNLECRRLLSDCESRLSVLGCYTREPQKRTH